MDRLNKKGVPVDIYSIWLDLPSFPKFNEGFRHIIRLNKSMFPTLSELFPTSQWALSYAQFKWKGHLFGPLKYQEQITKTAKEVIENEIGIKFNASAERPNKRIIVE